MSARSLFKMPVASFCAIAAVMLVSEVTWSYPPSGHMRKKPKAKPAKKGSLHDMPALSFKMKDIDGKEQDLRQYYGKVVLMVNTASKCGYTPQYKGLEEIYEKYKDEGLVVLAFPANEFGKQEPGSDSQIKDFCTTKYDVTFPIFSKVKVKGDGLCALYKYLTATDAGHKFGGEITWNFNKFLVNRKGELIGRFDTKKAPEKGEVLAAIEKALAEPAPEDAAGAEKKPAKPKKK
ncbi:MAG TPA: glutathione peroxidase [Phycisphaerae bacterium]|nr:glutathione peroxidase [Phycisphaerae bacterium]